jgi:hypothetical protein
VTRTSAFRGYSARVRLLRMLRAVLAVAAALAVACAKAPEPGHPKTIGSTPALPSPVQPSPVLKPMALDGPAPEVVTAPVKLALPIVPAFEMPPSEPGFHHPSELLVDGRKLLGTEVKVKGYITWIYNCLAAVRKPGEPRAQAQKRIDDDQTLCERAKFYLGSSKDTDPERSLWVVDVPRPPFKLEKERLPKSELANWPAVPKLAVGDYVIVTGNFNLSSPHAERNSDGLLVYTRRLGATGGAGPAPREPRSGRPRDT